jgi:Protein of unknown function (DUF3108)
MNPTCDRSGHSFFLVVFFALLLAGPGRGQQTAHRTTGHPEGRTKPAIEEQPAPFRIGETLNYRAAWAAFANAATVQLSVVERRDLFGWPTWHFRALIHTQNPTRMLFPIDDQTDSYSDRMTFESHQYELYLNEIGGKQTEVLHFVPAGKSPRAPGAAMVVLPGTLDPLGALYALRNVDWRRVPEFRAPVCDGHDVFEMAATREASAEDVIVDAGNFSATRIGLRLYRDGKEVPGIGFEIWLANDAGRTPVEMQAVLPFGNIRIELEGDS